MDRDLNKQIGIYYLYVFYRELGSFSVQTSKLTLPFLGRLLPGSSAPVITNLTILHHAPTSDDLSAG